MLLHLFNSFPGLRREITPRLSRLPPNLGMIACQVAVLFSECYWHL